MDGVEDRTTVALLVAALCIGIGAATVPLFLLIRWAMRLASLLPVTRQVDRTRLPLLTQELETAWQAHIDGKPALAVATSARTVDWLVEYAPNRCPWIFVNSHVNVLINAGLYRQALAVPKRWSPSARMAGRRADLPAYLLTQINLAEALYNLGRLGCAAKLLDGVRAEPEARRFPLVRAGVTMQLAWLAVLRGKSAEASELLVGYAPSALPKLFRSEYWYTRGAALRERGNLDEARQTIEQGVRMARRASSDRNGIFLLGSVAFRANDLRAAVRHFEQGVAHTYKAQGGDALLMLAEAYARLERPADMKRTYALVIERDPESKAARIAKRHLAAL